LKFAKYAGHGMASERHTDIQWVRLIDRETDSDRQGD
jgi:hypothetical protein